MISSYRRRALALGAAVMALTGAVNAPASASTQSWAPDHFGPICYVSCVNSGTEGDITWGNRTASMSGHVTDNDPNAARFTTLHIDAFAGSTKIDSDAITTYINSSSFYLVIGDPDLVGGINRIRLQLCQYWQATDVRIGCTTQYNYTRD